MLNICDATTVRELVSAYPQAFDILLGHGMCEDCRADPPPVPLHHFAAKHCGGNTEALLEQLRQSVGVDSGTSRTN